MLKLISSHICLLLLASSLCSSSATDSRFCSTDACVSLSATLMQSINATANPCDNFYEYACGGFHSRSRYDIDDFGGAYMDTSSRMITEMENRLHEILIDGSLHTPTDESNLKAAVLLTRALYRNCIRWGDMKYELSGDADSLTAAASKSIHSLLDQLLGNSSNVLSMSLELFLARSAAMGLGSIFNVGVPDELISLVAANVTPAVYANATKLMILTSTFNYTSDSLYWRPMLKFLMSSNATLSNSIFTSSALGAETEFLMAGVARDVKEIVESMENASQSFHGSLDDLELELGTTGGASAARFNLTLFLHNVLPRTGANRTTIIEVDNMPLLKALLSYFSRERAAIESSRSHLKKPWPQRLAFLILDVMLEFVDLLPACPLPQKPRSDFLSWKGRSSNRQCLETTRRLMEPALVWLYRQRFHPTSLDAVKKVIEATKAATVSGILAQDWISEADKAKMTGKVSDMRHYVGHQELSQRQLGAFYADTVAGLSAENMADIGYTLGLAMKSNAKRHLEILTDRPLMAPSTFYSELPFSVNAYYDMGSNSLAFPLGILMPPVYSPGSPDFAVYGGFATLVGHEIGHGFAELWFKASAEPGSAMLQLEPETEASYLQRVQCIRNEFSLLKSGTYENDTLAEDISDIVGLSVAYRAYVAERSAGADRLPSALLDPSGSGCGLDRQEANWLRRQTERLFFVMVAQTFCTKATSQSLDEVFRSGNSNHSAGPVRVNGMARSSVEFARAFECPAGSPMNPAEKCVFW